jgi:hypothetical protein
MSIDINDPRTMIGVVEQSKTPEQVIRGLFFKTEKTHDTVNLDVDKITRSRPRGWMVNPAAQGVVVTRGGYTTKTVKPGYFRRKTAVTAADALLRRAGEVYGGGMSPAERVAQIRGQDLRELKEQLDRDIEIMSAESLWTGIVNCYEFPEGAAAPVLARTIDFELPATHVVTLGTLWSGAADPMEQLATGARLCQTDSGLSPDILILDSALVPYFVQNTKVKDLLDNRRMQGSTIDFKPYGARATYVGHINYADLNVDVITYSAVYDSFATPAVSTPLVPSTYGGLFCTQAKYEMHYGVIQNLAAMRGLGGAYVGRYFPHQWEELDGSAAYLQLESSPLACNLQPESSYIFKAL